MVAKRSRVPWTWLPDSCEQQDSLPHPKFRSTGARSHRQSVKVTLQMTNSGRLGSLHKRLGPRIAWKQSRESDSHFAFQSSGPRVEFWPPSPQGPSEKLSAAHKGGYIPVCLPQPPIPLAFWSLSVLSCGGPHSDPAARRQERARRMSL